MSKQPSDTTLGDVLTERREVPSSDDLSSGRVRIISKIRFDTGRIELRLNATTNTGMILAYPGDLVISGINAAKGAIGIYKSEEERPVAATIHYGAYTPNPDRADLTYLWWFLRSRSFRELLAEYVPGGIKTELKAKRLLPIPIKLPPLAEQRRVVARIEELASQVNEARALRQYAITETQVLYSKLLSCSFESISTRPVPIGSVFRVSTGGTPSRRNPTYWNGTINWVSSGEVAFCGICNTEEKITALGVQNSNAKVYPPSTVLLAMIGQGKTRGQCAILRCHASTNQNVAGIHVYETEHSPDYVYWWLFSNYQKSRSTETGTAQPALSGERVKQMMIPLPSRDEQCRIVAELEVLQKKIDAARSLQDETDEELSALLPSILDYAFSGRI